jgi:hypothetical protein
MLQSWQTAVETSRKRWAESTAKRVDDTVVSYVRYAMLVGLFPYMHHTRVATTLVLLWCAWLSRTCSHDSVKTYLRRLRAWYRVARPSHEHSLSEFESPMLESFLLGLKKEKGGQPKRKRPITPEMLAAFANLARSRDTHEDAIFLFAIFIDFFCFLRKSNLTVEKDTLFDVTKMIRRSDIRVDRSQHVLWVRVRRTKTLQSGDRELWIPIQGVPGHVLDIVAVHDRAMAAYPHTRADAHVFSACWEKSDELQPLKYSKFLKTLKEWVRAIGLNPENVAGHSLRRGGASFAFHSGVSPEIIKAQGDWQSDCYLLYCVIPPSRLVDATRQMFEKMYAGDWGGEIWSASRNAR